MVAPGAAQPGEAIRAQEIASRSVRQEKPPEPYHCKQQAPTTTDLRTLSDKCTPAPWWGRLITSRRPAGRLATASVASAKGAKATAGPATAAMVAGLAALLLLQACIPGPAGQFMLCLAMVLKGIQRAQRAPFRLGGPLGLWHWLGLGPRHRVRGQGRASAAGGAWGCPECCPEAVPSRLGPAGTAQSPSDQAGAARCRGARRLSATGRSAAGGASAPRAANGECPASPPAENYYHACPSEPREHQIRTTVRKLPRSPVLARRLPPS